MRLKINKTIKNGGLFSIFSFLNQGISFVLLVILAKYITPSEYGSLSLYNTVSTFVGFFIALSTTGYASVSYFRNERQEYCKDVSSIIAIALSVFSLLMLFVLIFSNSLNNALNLPYELLYVILINSFFYLLSTVYLDYERVRENVGIYGVLSVSSVLLIFIDVMSACLC